MNAMVISATTLSNGRAHRSTAGTTGPWRFQPATDGAASGSASRPAPATLERMQSQRLQSGAMRSDSVSMQSGPAVNGGDRARLQLTRRGRLVLLGVPAILTAAVMVFAALAIGLGSIATPAQAAAGYAAVDLEDYAVSVTVLPGDNLWSIAGASNPNGDVRDVVREIVALNELGSGVLQAGQRLYVPRTR